MTGRGAGWVVAQFILMAVIVAAGFIPPDWPAGARAARDIAAAALVIGGGAIAVWARRALGRSFSPFPRPVPAGLVTGGPFAIVRHPIYTGMLLLSTGYALFTSIPALALTGVLAVLWARKLRVEETLLTSVYEGYPAYRQNVPWRLVPFVY